MFHALGRIVAGIPKESPEFLGGHAEAAALLWGANRDGIDTSTVGDGSGNSAVYASLRVKGLGFQEPRIRVVQMSGGIVDEVAQHPCASLLEAPNPWFTKGWISRYLIAAKDLAGTGYLIKNRDASGRVVELWPVSPRLMRPLAGSELTPGQREILQVDESAFIGAFEYSPGGRRTIYGTSEVIRFMDDPDPDNPRVGRSALQTVLREIVADEEAATMAAALVRNMGVPGLVISPKDTEASFTPTDARKLKRAAKEKFTGSRRGEPFVATGGPLNVDIVSFSPEQMDLKHLRRIPEERIAAVTGVPAVLSSLGAGLDRPFQGNVRDLREFFTENTLIPEWINAASIWTNELLRADFDDTPGRSVEYDLSTVRALRTDRVDDIQEMDRGVRAGVVMVSEARRARGLPVRPDDAVYLRAWGGLAVDPDDQAMTAAETFGEES